MKLVRNHFQRARLWQACLLVFVLFAGSFVAPTHAYKLRLFSPAMVMGQGVHNRKQVAVGVCMKPCLSQSASATEPYCQSLNMKEANVSFTLSTDLEQVKRELGIQAEVHIRSSHSVDAAMQFAKRSTEDKFSIVFIFVSKYSLGRTRLYNAQFKIPFETLYKNGKNDLLKKVCGDRFVHEIVRGAKLFVSLRISFSSSKQKRDFQAKVGVSSSLASVSAALKANKEKFGQSVRLSLQAHQIGGAVENLSTIFGTGSELLDCSFGNFGQCLSAMKRAMKYSSVSFVKGIKKKGGAAIIGYSTTTYENIGKFGLKLPIGKVLQINRASIERFSRRLFPNLVTAQRLLNGQLPIRINTRQRGALRKYERSLNALLLSLESIARTCYDKPIQCGGKMRQRITALTKSFGKLPHDVLEVEPETFAQYCDFSEQPDTDIGIKLTVDRMKAWLRSVLPRGAYQSISDVCGKIEKVMARKRGGIRLHKYLDLSIKSARHTAKIAFTKLTSKEKKKWTSENAYISHHSKRLVTIEPLAMFSFVETFNLEGNDIRSLFPVVGWTQLTKINLKGNKKLKKLSPLKRLPKLTTVILDPVQQACPLGLKNRSMGFFRPIKLACGSYHCCAMSKQGRVQCWGYNSKGAVGVDAPRRKEELYVTENNIRRLMSPGSLRKNCIAVNGLIMNTSVPFSLHLKGVADLVAGHQHTCVLKSSGRVVCWGANQHGQLGRPGLKWRSIPLPVLAKQTNSSFPSPLQKVSRIAVSGATSCALDRTGQVWCWGALGGKKHTLASKWLTIQGKVHSFDVEKWGLCAVVTKDQKQGPLVRCYSFANRNASSMLRLSGGPVFVKVAGTKACSLMKTGQLRCWHVSVSTSGFGLSQAKEIHTSRLKDFTLGRKHICTVSHSGHVECWGNNCNQQLGLASKMTKATTPQTVHGLKHAVSVASHTDQTCVLMKFRTKHAQVKCWGRVGLYSQAHKGVKGLRQYVPYSIGLWQP